MSLWSPNCSWVMAESTRCIISKKWSLHSSLSFLWRLTENGYPIPWQFFYILCQKLVSTITNVCFFQALYIKVLGFFLREKINMSISWERRHIETSCCIWNPIFPHRSMGIRVFAVFPEKCGIWRSLNVLYLLRISNTERTRFFHPPLWAKSS